MRADELAKKEVYKQRITKDCIAQSKYPSAKELDEALSSINLMESYFKIAPVSDGEYFETKTFNAQIEDLDADLKLLYSLVKQFTLDKLNALNQYADTTLTDLERKADFYLNKSRLEMQSSDLGRTALYLRAPLSGKQNGEYFSVDCGMVALTNGSTIHLILEGHDTYYARLKLADGNQTFYITPYNLNQQSFKLPGEIKTTEKEVKITHTPQLGETILLPYEIQEACDYIVLTGKNQIACKTAIKSEYQDYKYYACFEDTMIDFYVKDATSIQIRVSHKPLNSNYDFLQDVIKLEKGIKHFYLEMPAKSAVEIFLEGGEIYAQKGKGVIQSDKLYFAHSTPFKDFLIIEKSRTLKTIYQASLEVRSTIEDLGVESIMIKELI